MQTFSLSQHFVFTLHTMFKHSISMCVCVCVNISECLMEGSSHTLLKLHTNTALSAAKPPPKNRIKTPLHLLSGPHPLGVSFYLPQSLSYTAKVISPLLRPSHYCRPLCAFTRTPPGTVHSFTVHKWNKTLIAAAIQSLWLHNMKMH